MQKNQKPFKSKNNYKFNYYLIYNNLKKKPIRKILTNIQVVYTTRIKQFGRTKKCKCLKCGAMENSLGVA